VRDTQAEAPRQEVQFDPVTVTADLELSSLNDEELFAGGTSAFAANDFAKAARYFGRLADFHPNSSHRHEALYNAGLAHERLEQWEDAAMRFSELADPQKGTGDALDASFRLAETQYHLERFDEAAKVLKAIAEREDLPVGKRLEAQVQQGVCELESGQPEKAEATLQKSISTYDGLADKDEVEDYFPAQAHFFRGEIYRLYYDAVKLDPAKGSDALANDLNYKAELLLSAQGHYLRSIRVGNGGRLADWRALREPLRAPGELARAGRAGRRGGADLPRGAAQEGAGAAHQVHQHLRAHAGGGRAHRLAEHLRGPHAREPGEDEAAAAGGHGHGADSRAREDRAALLSYAPRCPWSPSSRPSSSRKSRPTTCPTTSGAG
jgi:tetratricopeptide (TPR) repeat protein